MNFFLIPKLGVNGAVLATLASYIVVFVLRAINVRGLMHIDYAPLKLCVNCAILVLESLLMLFNIGGWPIWCTLLCVLVLAINFRDIIGTVLQLLRKNKKKKH